MTQYRNLEGRHKEDQTDELAKGGGVLPGVPATPPTRYRCAECARDVLAQDVIWDRNDRPFCPEGHGPLVPIEN